MRPAIPPRMIRKLPMRVIMRMAAPIRQHRAEVSPILPGTSPKNRWGRENPWSARVAVRLPPPSAVTARAVAPVTPSTALAPATHILPDMVTG